MASAELALAPGAGFDDGTVETIDGPDDGIVGHTRRLRSARETRGTGQKRACRPCCRVLPRRWACVSSCTSSTTRRRRYRRLRASSGEAPQRSAKQVAPPAHRWVSPSRLGPHADLKVMRRKRPATSTADSQRQGKSHPFCPCACRRRSEPHRGGKTAPRPPLPEPHRSHGSGSPRHSLSPRQSPRAAPVAPPPMPPPGASPSSPATASRHRPPSPSPLQPFRTYRPSIHTPPSHRRLWPASRLI